MNSGSKSTDKLFAVKEIVSTTLNALSQQKCDKLLSVDVTWDTLVLSIDQGSVAVPNIKMTFKE